MERQNFGDSKSVGASVQESRIHYAAGYRVYYGRDGNHIVVLLIGGTKATQPKDIETAKKYWLDYKARQGATKSWR